MFKTVMLALVVLSPPALAAPPAQEDAVLARGREVYRASSCGVCHTFRATDTHGAFGPPHDGLAGTVRRRFADGSYTGAAKDVRAYLRESLLAPDAYLVPEYAGSRYLMPAATNLSSEDLEALISLLASGDARKEAACSKPLYSPPC